MAIRPLIVGWFRCRTMGAEPVISLSQPPGESVAVVTVLDSYRYAQEKMLEQRAAHAQICRDVFDDYWHRNKGGDSANRGALAAVAQECMDRILARNPT